ncbi:hypothetical protein [Absiella sp. AM29-15]|mgnify:CR=1 FL=1|nr:hypothetical protein [Absiella sp. AM29-15]
MKKELMEKIAKKSYKKAMKSAMKVSQRGIYQLKEPKILKAKLKKEEIQ